MVERKEYLDFDISDRYKNQLEVWYRAYNIHREKIELFYDYLSSLYNLVDTTFLGSDVLYDEKEQKNHFSWCWDKIISDFEKEKIYFKDRGNHYEYFWNFFFEAFYLPKVEETPIKIAEYLHKLFNFDYVKSRSELDILTEVYKLLEKNLKK